MIPKIPFFRTPIRHSAFSSSFYNPHNLILKINEADNTIPGNELDYHFTYIHEFVHWIQHHGTTFGAFLDALRFTQRETTLTNLRGLPQNVCQDLLQRREIAGLPILKIDSTKPKIIRQEFTTHKEDIDFFGQIWFELQWVYSFLNDCSISEKGIHPGGDIFGLVFRDIYLYYFLKDKSSLSEKEINEVTKWYNFSDDEITLIRYGGKDLTSHLLMECSATISELQTIIGNSNTAIKKFIKGEDFKKRIDILLDTSYGLPFKLFVNKLEVDPEYIETICATLNVLIFIALNPPIPPFSYGPPPYGDTWKWNDIYPPVRFVRAIDAVKKIGFLKPYANHTETKEYMEAIVGSINMPTIIDNTPLKNNTLKQIDFSNVDAHYDPNNIAFDSYDFSQWVQINFSKMRDNSLHFLSNFSTTTFGEYSSDFIELLVDRTEIQFSKPPFYWVKSGNIAFGNHKDFYNSLLRSVSINYCLFDTVVGHSNYDLSEFPPLIATENFTSFIKNNINHNLSVTRNL